MPHIVYCHMHVESGRRYVGVTSQTMEKRWSQHISKSKSSKGGRWHFPNAIRKYGKNTFSHEVLGVFDSLEEANKEEERLIDEWNLRNPEKGFNLAKGGEHKPHPTNNPWDDPEFRETHLPISLVNMSHMHTPEARAKSVATSSRPDVRKKHAASVAASFLSGRRAKSKPPSLETRKKISTSIRSKLTSSEYKVCKHHGLVPIALCVREKTRIGERFKCRQCARNASRSCQSRRRFKQRSRKT